MNIIRPQKRHRLRASAAALPVIACLLFPLTTARAADDKDSSRRSIWAIKLGALFLNERQGARNPGAGRFVAELEVDLHDGMQREYGRPVSTLLSVGYIDRDKLRILPITLSAIYRDRSRSDHFNSSYLGAGAGLYITRSSADEASGKTRELPGAFAVAGVDFGRKIFLEAKYHIISRYEGRNINGFQFTTGMRF